LLQIISLNKSIIFNKKTKKEFAMSQYNEPPQQNDYSYNYGMPQQPLPNSTTVLVLGILSIVGCFCYGIPGIILGIIALVLHSKDKALLDVNPDLYTAGSVSNLNAGRVCAIIGLCLSALALVYIILVYTIAFTGLSVLSGFPFSK